MIDKLQSIINKYNELSDSLSDPNIISNTKKFAKIAKEHNSLNEIVEKSKIYIDKTTQLKSTQEILYSDDNELVSLAKDLKLNISNEKNNKKIFFNLIFPSIVFFFNCIYICFWAICAF